MVVEAPPQQSFRLQPVPRPLPSGARWRLRAEPIRDSTDALMVQAYYSDFRVWAGCGVFGIRPAGRDHAHGRPSARPDHSLHWI